MGRLIDGSRNNLTFRRSEFAIVAIAAGLAVWRENLYEREKKIMKHQNLFIYIDLNGRY